MRRQFQFTRKFGVTEAITRMAVTDGRIKSKAGMMPPYRVMLMPDAFCSSIRFAKSTMTAAASTGGVPPW